MLKSIQQLRHCIRIVLCATPGLRGLVRMIDALFANAHKRTQQSVLQAIWKELYVKLHSALSRAGVRYWFDFGSLIGLMRENGVLLHDQDVDCCIGPEVDFSNVYSALVSNGFDVVRGYACNGEVSELTFSYKGIGIDFFKCHKIGNKLGHYVYQVQNDLRTCMPIKVVAHERIRPDVERIVEHMVGDVEAVTVAIPENYDEMLTASYGTWRIPDKTTDFCRRDIPSQYRDVDEGCRVLSQNEVKVMYSLSN